MDGRCPAGGHMILKISLLLSEAILERLPSTIEDLQLTCIIATLVVTCIIPLATGHTTMYTTRVAVSGHILGITTEHSVCDEQQYKHLAKEWYRHEDNP